MQKFKRFKSPNILRTILLEIPQLLCDNEDIQKAKTFWEDYLKSQSNQTNLDKIYNFIFTIFISMEILCLVK